MWIKDNFYSEEQVGFDTLGTLEEEEEGIGKDRKRREEGGGGGKAIWGSSFVQAYLEPRRWGEKQHMDLI